jgi:hypothetical protein
MSYPLNLVSAGGSGSVVLKDGLQLLAVNPTDLVEVEAEQFRTLGIE